MSEADLGPALARLDSRLAEIAGFVRGLPDMLGAMVSMEHRLSMIEDDLATPPGPSPLLGAIEKLTEAVKGQTDDLRKLAMLSDAPTAHAEWREWLDALQVDFAGLVNDPTDPEMAVTWEWVSENRPPPDERSAESA